MIKLVILLSICSCVLSLRYPKVEVRIAGGLPGNISDYPWQISLQHSGKHTCGGSIFNDKIIVTAAHCFKNDDVSKLQIRAGSSYWDKGGVVVKVAAFRSHKDYDPDVVNNDIAVIRLKSPLPLGSNIKPIPLTTNEPGDGTSAVVTGWGILKEGNSSLPSQLQYVNLNIVDRKTCSAAYEDFIIDSNTICAAADDKDACPGDSGGPLVADGSLVGVVSFGLGCADPNYPGVYVNVFKLREWITENAKKV
ncbi:trypsin beta-like [Teleopsis dalmanni]|uniref:trypsin beta-like n=1 Tax=Teleopsis dalmanni TaxID=139649 RepID=UPI0018CDBD12|nr:trypsin beta-like [Teleopsis dalmanni]XP_037944776.1 trypsin beta-like [Teleopsis dalmanni]